MSTFQLVVVTPERTVLEQEVESVLLPTTGGQLGIWANHAPLLAGLQIGVVEYGSKQHKKERLAVGGGFVEMAENKLTVLANTAELAQEIDELRAKEAKERAAQRLEDRQANWDAARAEIALKKAIARLKAVDKS